MPQPLAWVLGLSLLLASALPSFAQNFGQITGIVSDPSGGVLVGASVAVTNTQTGATSTQQANSAGVYVFPNLLPGIYNVKVELDGFRGETRNRVELQIQQTIRLDFRLELGTLNETVEATATAPMLNTEDLTIGTVIENRRIVELPLNGRNFLKMVELTPNVSASFSGHGSSGPRQGGDRSNQQLSIGGGRREWNYFTLDGINNTDVNFNSYIFLPSIDALQEFKVQTGIYSAELGRELGQVSVTTKCGHQRLPRRRVRVRAQQQIRCAAIRICRRDARNRARSNGISSASRSAGRLNSVPSSTARTSSSSWRTTRDSGCAISARRCISVPSVAMRNGDFSQITTVLRDPLTNAPFPGNTSREIGSARSRLACSNYYPVPNQPTTGLANNYLAVNQNTTDKNQIHDQTSTWSRAAGRRGTAATAGQMNRFTAAGFVLNGSIVRHQRASGRRRQRAGAEQHTRE